MKKLFVPILAAIALFVAAGCSEKFNVGASYKNITVVYGYLDAADTAHYIRIQKAFLDQNKSALVMAQTPDSSYYANLNVKIERFNFSDSANPHPVDTIHLTRVDLDQEGYPKQPGQFFTAPNYAYKFTNKLDPRYIYRIVINNPTTGVTDSADAPIIDDANPVYFYVDALDSNLHLQMDFHDTVGNKYFEMTGQYVATTGFSFEGLSNPAVIGQTIVRFNWDDSDAVTHKHTPRYYDFNAGFFYPTTNGGIDVKLNNTTLYAAAANALDPAPANTFRLLNRCEIYVYLSTKDFLNYQQTSLTQGTGLTGSEIEPVYTNVKGPGVIGLYTSRAMRTSKITLTNLTVDLLKSGPLLSTAKVVGTVY